MGTTEKQADQPVETLQKNQEFQEREGLRTNWSEAENLAEN
jgi:hypothetical protein